MFGSAAPSLELNDTLCGIFCQCGLTSKNKCSNIGISLL
nr:MAG TPA: hypothetical protein [Caudoviricetes sp.]